MCLKEEGGTLILKVLVQPRASKNEVVGIHGGCLKIRVTSPPIEGKANKMLCGFLSQLIGIGKRHIEIIGGQRARVKEVRISDKSMEEVRKKLNVITKI